MINSKKLLELQRITKAYTRSKMFQMNEDRQEIMKNRDTYLDKKIPYGETNENSVSAVIITKNNKIKKKTLY